MERDQVHDHVYDGGITVQARRRLNAGSATRLAPPAGGADLGAVWLLHVIKVSHV